MRRSGVRFPKAAPTIRPNQAPLPPSVPRSSSGPSSEDAPVVAPNRSAASHKLRSIRWPYRSIVIAAKHAPASAERPWDRRRRSAMQTLPCAADRVRAARAAQSLPLPDTNPLTASNSSPAEDRLPALRTASHSEPCRCSTDPRWARPPALAERCGHLCSSVLLREVLLGRRLPDLDRLNRCPPRLVDLADLSVRGCVLGIRHAFNALAQSVSFAKAVADVERLRRT
jgi:hypothetical protein